MEIIEFNRNRFANEITVKVKIFPPLYVFTLYDLKEVFVIPNPIFKVASLTYNPATQ